MPTRYEVYMAEKGWPIVRGNGVASIVDLHVGPSHVSAEPHGAFLDLLGMDGVTDIAVLDLPAGATFGWTRHLYEAWVLVLSGQGSVEFRSSAATASGRQVVTHSLRTLSLAAIPLNMSYRLTNSGSSTMRVVSVTNAPLYIDLLGHEAVFSSDLSFPDREATVLEAPDESVDMRAYRDYNGNEGWQLGFFRGAVVPDVSTQPLQPGDSLRGEGFDYISLEDMGGGTLGAHIGEMGPRTMSNAHYHMGGAILLCVSGGGYTLAWPQSAGRRPHESGSAARAVRHDFGFSGAVAVGTEWYHQHLNPYPAALRHVAFRYGKTSRAGFARAHHYQEGEGATGRILALEELDPAIHETYAKEVAAFDSSVRQRR